MYTYAGLGDSKLGTEASPYHHTNRDKGSQDLGSFDALDIPSPVGENALGHTHTRRLKGGQVPHRSIIISAYQP